MNGCRYFSWEDLQEPACVFLRSSNNNFLKRRYSVRIMPDLSGRRLCIVGSHPASTEVSPAYQELMMKCPWNRSLFLDLEFWEWILKTLTPSLQENIRYFTTHSYLTLTVFLAKHRVLWHYKYRCNYAYIRRVKCTWIFL